jgi:choline dehydrogenase
MTATPVFQGDSVSTTADYVIAGGGSAGCVLANRLSEDPRARVVLLEAGGPSDDFWISLPATFGRAVGNPDRNWFYMTEPDPTIGGRRVIWHAGRMLGGGSAINGMAYVRGARYDYDEWAREGCAGWSWTEVLPYFVRSETFEGEPSQVHGGSGPLGVSPLRVVHPLARAFMQACGEAGLGQVPDYCEGDVDGAFQAHATQRKGWRSSTASSYLAQAKRRPNLKVVTGALVDRVLIEEGRACGVVYRQGGEEHVVRADGEVILSAGAMASPAILMRSGVGPGAHLRGLGVEVRDDAKNVGRNLQEHSSVHNSRLTSLATYNAIKNPFRLAVEGLNYALFRRGMLATPAVHAMASARSRPDAPHPDIRMQLMPFCTDMEKKTPHKRSGIAVSIGNLFPKARGEIRLKSADAQDKPVIDYRLYEHPEDLAVMRAGMKLVDRIFDAPALARYVVGRNFPPAGERSDDELDQLIRAYSGVGFHPIGSCRMGGDPDSVVDPELRVRRVSGLRVIDASVMPLLPSANTNAPTIMIAEKGADLIKDAAAGRR